MLTTPRFTALVYVDMFLSEVTNCVAGVADWMQSNRLQLNDN